MLTTLIISSIMTERERSQRELQERHDLLEMRVAERTADLSFLNTQLHQEINERKIIESELAQVDRALAEFEQMREGLIPNSARAMHWPRLEENTLAELRRLEQGAYFSLGDFLRQFNIDGRARIDKMRQAVVDGDTATLEREAHTLKGGSRELGARYLSELCFELEKMSRAGEGMGEAGAQQVRSIAEEFAAVCNELVRRREG